MFKNPKYDLKFQYRKVLEASLILSLLLMLLTFMVSKRFANEINIGAATIVAIQVEDIPITRTVKRVEVPQKPIIPVEDPDIPLEDDVPINFYENPELNIAEPPPPPPEETEDVPYYVVEHKPVLAGDSGTIARYITEHNLFPVMALNLGVGGEVIIVFTVDIDGKPIDVRVKEEIPEGLGFGEAGVEVMKHMMFSPGKQRDKFVRVPMQQTIIFTAEN